LPFEAKGICCCLSHSDLTDLSFYNLTLENDDKVFKNCGRYAYRKEFLGF
jgi:hypothetical protein